MTPATHVTIDYNTTYKLGRLLPSGGTLSQVQCIAPDGLVHRVCTWREGWGMGTVVFTGGERLQFHRNGFADNEVKGL